MKKIFFLAVTFLIILSVFTSCQKDSGTNYSADINSLMASVQALQLRCDSLSQALSATNAYNAALGQSIDSIKAQLTVITTEISQLNSQLGTVNANISSIDSQIAILNQEYASILAKLNALLNQLNGVPSSLSSGLVLWLPFTGNVADSSGNNNNGTLYGASLIADRFGIPNSAYIFNGTSNYIQIETDTLLQPQSSISLAAWVYIDSSATANFQRIISKQYSQAQYYSSYQLIAGNAGEDSLGYPGLTITSTSAYNWTGHSGSSFLNRWVHICGTWDGTNMRFYQNGNLVVTRPETGAILYDNENLYVGRGTDGNGNAEYFKGLIDEVRIYNRALTQSEITYLATH